MRTRGGINTTGIVLLAMLVLAAVVGVGSSAYEAVSSKSDPDPEQAVATVNPTPDQGSAPMPISTAPADAGDDAAPPSGDATDAQAASGDQTTSGDVPDTGLGVTAQAVYAFDATTNETLIEHNPSERMPVGSIVKIATALVTIEHVGLDETVLIDSTDLVDYNVYSNMGLIAGDTLTVVQLLNGLLIPSGGDAAEALARYVGGQLSGSDDPDTARAAFVDAMNAYAAEMGLDNTHFANAGGDEAADSYSSAEDIALLASALMANDDLATIVAQYDYSFTGQDGVNTYTGATTNQLLGTNGVIGVKTGSTGEAGGCVVLAQETAEGDLVIVTILGSDLAYNELNQIIADARWDDAQALFGQI